ncbi:2105_t:CDS:1, partial [Gigaspora rosea]
MKQKATEAYTSQIGIVDEEDFVHWFVSGFKEPYHSKVTASSCTSYKVVKVVAKIMEK